MQRDTSSHKVDQAVDCGRWNIVPLLFNGSGNLLDIACNVPLYTSIQSTPKMLNG
jgi:hypothetical protein